MFLLIWHCMQDLVEVSFLLLFPFAMKKVIKRRDEMMKKTENRPSTMPRSMWFRFF